MPRSVEKTESQWREELTAEEHAVLRRGATERPFTGRYTETRTRGVYRCRGCSAELFSSAAKFDASCGWPSFFTPLAADAVELLEDTSGPRVRTEVRCAACGSHLGHVFTGEGHGTPTDERWCINSVAMTLEPREAFVEG